MEQAFPRVENIQEYMKEILKVMVESMWKIYEIHNYFSKQDASGLAAFEKKLEEFHLSTLKANYQLTEDIFLSELSEDKRKSLENSLKEVSMDCREFTDSDFFGKIVGFLKPMNSNTEDVISQNKNLGKKYFSIFQKSFYSKNR